MYDSDEVRDAVRREMLAQYGYLPGITLTPLSRERQAALDDARAWCAAELLEALHVYLAEQEARRAAQADELAAVMEKLRQVFERFAEVATEAMKLLAQGMSPVIEAFENLALAVEASQDGEATLPPWKRRRREPDIRPVQHVDAVAAGRHPAMIQRTQIRGGRR